MREPINYLCLKLDELNQSDLYKQYEREYSKLRANDEYLEVLNRIKSVDKIKSKSEYFKYKTEITKFEMSFREVEREINIYINHMLKRYNECFYHSKLDQKRSKG